MQVSQWLDVGTHVLMGRYEPMRMGALRRDHDQHCCKTPHPNVGTRVLTVVATMRTREPSVVTKTGDSDPDSQILELR